MSKRDIFWLLVKQLIVAAVVVTFIRGFILIPIQVTGSSMRNLLKPGDTVVMEKISSVRRFDIVVFTREDGSTLVKRVIGLPGEKISVVDDELYINDKKVAETFLADEKAQDKSKLPFTSNFELQDLTDAEVLGKDEYFVMGDNRRASKDSRAFGPIKQAEILGKARLVYWPLKDIKWLG